jgi:hypothetical protein
MLSWALLMEREMARKVRSETTSVLTSPFRLTQIDGKRPISSVSVKSTMMLNLPMVERQRGHPLKSMNLAVASTHEPQTTLLQQGNTHPGQSIVSRQTGHMLPSSFVAIMMKKARCGLIYAAGDRSVPQNWATAVKWWRKAAEAGEKLAQRYMGLCYYYGRGVDRDVAQAMIWFGKAAAQGNAQAARVVQTGIPGQGVRGVIVLFTNAASAPPRHAAAHEFAREVNEKFLRPRLQSCSRMLQEDDSAVPRQFLRDSM